MRERRELRIGRAARHDSRRTVSFSRWRIRENRIAIVLAAATALLAAPAARAQQAPVQATSAKRFAAVDSVAAQGYLVIVAGIVQGDSAASSWSFNMGPQNPYVESTVNVCAHFGSVAMLKPGALLLTVSPYGSGPQYSLIGCTLTRVTP